MNHTKLDISSSGLHILAMLFMLADHVWAAVFPQQWWLTCVGRLAFPIFAFMIVEGYFHTRNFKKYLLRMFLFALVSELPFNLLYGGVLIYPYHQNVLWTFCLALLAIASMEHIRQKGRLWLSIWGCAGVSLAAFLGSFAIFSDFHGGGILMILLFYFLRGNRWWQRVGQFLGMWWINMEVMGGLCYVVTILGTKVELVQQGFAILALIPIWLYSGRKGYSSKAFQYFCYSFYPLHCLVLGLITVFR